MNQIGETKSDKLAQVQKFEHKPHEKFSIQIKNQDQENEQELNSNNL